MAFELIYTSARQGLQPGSTGFCTVGMTNGMAPSLVRKLEGLTGYRPFYEHFDSRAALNPPAIFHYLWSEGRSRYDIVGRVCACAPDHTGRSNKLAHFFIVNEKEKENCPGGAADFGGGASSFLTQWQGAPQLFPTEHHFSGSAYIPKVATLWQQYMGDAGWAGYLAQCFVDAPEKPVYILYHPERHRDILELVSEALNVLPLNMRWKVSYNTCFMSVPVDIQCNWRFCIDAPEYTRSILASADVIRLGEKRPLPQESAFTAAARTTSRDGLWGTMQSFSQESPEPGMKSLGEIIRTKANSGSGEAVADTPQTAKPQMRLRKEKEMRPAFPNVVPPQPQFQQAYQFSPQFMAEGVLQRRVTHWKVVSLVLSCVLFLLLFCGTIGYVGLLNTVTRQEAELTELRKASSSAKSVGVEKALPSGKEDINHVSSKEESALKDEKKDVETAVFQDHNADVAEIEKTAEEESGEEGKDSLKSSPENSLKGVTAKDETGTEGNRSVTNASSDTGSVSNEKVVSVGKFRWGSWEDKARSNRYTLAHVDFGVILRKIMILKSDHILIKDDINEKSVRQYFCETIGNSLMGELKDMVEKRYMESEMKLDKKDMNEIAQEVFDKIWPERFSKGDPGDVKLREFAATIAKEPETNTENLDKVHDRLTEEFAVIRNSCLAKFKLLCDIVPSQAFPKDM